MSIVNISGYKFVALDDLEGLKEQLLMKLNALAIKGTILISAEGINIMVAGTRESIDAFYEYLKADQRFAQDILFKESLSETIPFKRTVVKIKNEIISMRVAGVSPKVNGEAAEITPEQFKAWMDAGKDITVLDTRNDYEIRFGSFDNAVDLDIQNFREFPQEAANQLPESAKEKPLVMFCTGGVRCEKAAIELTNQGFKDVYQLSGGILKYFEDCGDAHYQGDCFVFDDRVAIDPQLQETGAIQCKVCDEPLSKAEQAQPEFVDGVSCPYCIQQTKSA